jgi:hypothetical protein
MMLFDNQPLRTESQVGPATDASDGPGLVREEGWDTGGGNWLLPLQNRKRQAALNKSGPATLQTSGTVAIPLQKELQ